MSLFLKQNKKRKGIYLQICDSTYDPTLGYGTQKVIESLGYVDELIAQGIVNPIEHFSRIVIERNGENPRETKADKIRKACFDEPLKNLGYFLIKTINDNLGVKGCLDFIGKQSGLSYSLYKVLSSLVYARVIDPCSKRRTVEDVLPNLFDASDVTLDHIYESLGTLGEAYEEIIDVYNNYVNEKWGRNLTHTYFDCTNFYFEIDCEDDFRRKGPSKENRRDPIVGMGLLLDADRVPIGMKMYPGNQSEKPIIRDVIKGLKERSGLDTNTVRVADKGLNCAENIHSTTVDGDGYIFSKSVKQLPEVEKTWILLDQDYKDVKDSDGTLKYRYKEWVDKFPYSFKDKNGRTTSFEIYEKRVVTFNPKLAEKKRQEILKMVDNVIGLSARSAKRCEYGDAIKYTNLVSTDSDGNLTDEKVVVQINEEAIQKDLQLAGYNMLVTSEVYMPAIEVYDAYHNLWRIEETFRLMKSQLSARPVFLQKRESIIGHFLVCYIAVLLTRILQFKIFKNHYSTETIINFIRKFQVMKCSQKGYFSFQKLNQLGVDLYDKYKVNVRNGFYTKLQIEDLLNNRNSTPHATRN